MKMKKKAAAAKKTKSEGKQRSAESDDFSAELIKELNKESGSTIAFNLGTDAAPTNIKRWISTGSRQLDSIISNMPKGGFPEGRIVEVYGPAGCGKSHVATLAARSTQQQGGIVVYIDTENATNLQNLEILGVNVHERFVFVQTACTEEIFAVAESAIMKARAMTQDVPVTIIWDSVAASSPKAELEGDYDQNSIGLNARSIGKGMRKIVNIIGNQNVLFLLVNQQRTKIGVMFGDPMTTPGGMAIPYACSVRIAITSTGQSHIKDKEGNIIGIKVRAKTAKNKVSVPFRSCEFQILFGRGIVEHEEVFDLFRTRCSKEKVTMPNGDVVDLSGTGAWKNFLVTSSEGEVKHDEKFYKPDFGKKILYNPEFHDYMEALYGASLVVVRNQEATHDTVDGPDLDSYSDVQALHVEATAAQ